MANATDSTPDAKPATIPWTPEAEALRDRVVDRLRELLDEQVPKFAADTEAREIEPCDVEIVLANFLGDGRWALLTKPGDEGK